MKFTYEQKTGYFMREEYLFDRCYAGHGEGLNNPDMQEIHNVGPLPCGFYYMMPAKPHPHTGPGSIELVPFDTNEMFGRFGFFIHGDDVAHPGQFVASDGCIIMDHDHRVELDKIAQAFGNVLEVVRW